MIAQVTAAALASETRRWPRRTPWIRFQLQAGKKITYPWNVRRERLRPMLDNLRRILAVEILAACQGIDFTRR